MLVPGSLVFQPTAGPVDLRDWSQWWSWTPGAGWRRPEGPTSHIGGREYHPVVHVAYDDAAAYAAWVGKDLPTEAEWEYAARGGLDGAAFTWGDELTPRGRVMANTWQGRFPWESLRPDGRQGTTAVGSYPANGYGLFDMAGNVWEWTRDFFSPVILARPPNRAVCPATLCAPQPAGRRRSRRDCRWPVRVATSRGG